MDKIVSLARRRGFVFPSSEIYGGLGSAYDYGHYGVLLKNNLRSRWLESMVQEREDVVALDTAIILNPRVWEASGHVAGFTDPLVDCRTCKLRFRADHLADPEHEEVRCGKRPSKRPGEIPDCDLTEPRQFNLMFETTIGPVQETGAKAYLRPETAQGIFINFKNVAQLARRKPPFGIANVGGKSFRNEITPGNFLFRVLEFEQMEMEYFVPPAEADEWYRFWIDERVAWYKRYGLRESHLRVREHAAEELSHYSSATSDLEYLYPIGWSELEGIANRGDFDLTQHSEHSGTKLEWVDAGTGERFVPHVIEPAVSIERMLLAFLIDAYDEEVVAERERTVLRLHPALAPVKAAVLPLIGKNADMVVEGALAVRGAARRRAGRVRRQRRDRPALPAAGRDRHAVRVHRRRADARRRHGDDPRPRLARAGADRARAGARAPDRRAAQAVELAEGMSAPWSYPLAGRFEEHVFESEALRGNPLGDPHERPLWVYLPPGYDDEPGAALPVDLRDPGVHRPARHVAQPAGLRREDVPGAVRRRLRVRRRSARRRRLGRRLDEARRLAVHRLARRSGSTTRISATSSSRGSTSATGRSRTRRTAGSRASRRAATAR